jgi:hypothetical protein
MKKIAIAVAGIAALIAAGTSLAKLPAPSDEAKAKADEAKAKTAWGDKVAAYKLCLAQDKVAGNYRKVKGKDAKPATETPACQDPGPYVTPVAPVAPVASAPPAPATAAASSPAASKAAPPPKK